MSNKYDSSWPLAWPICEEHGIWFGVLVMSQPCIVARAMLNTIKFIELQQEISEC